MKKELLHIYDRLYRYFGPQHWWPAESEFEVVVGAILTQSVSWKNVEIAIQNLKKEGILTIQGIADVDKVRLAELIKSTLYYNQKAEKLKRFCNHLKENYGCDIFKLFNKEMYDLRAELLSIKGIGKETADSIILYAAKKPIFVVDAYTRRIFHRLGYFREDEDYQSMQDFFMGNLPPDVDMFNEYHALIVAEGKDFCTSRKPKCNVCPLSDICKYWRK